MPLKPTTPPNPSLQPSTAPAADPTPKPGGTPLAGGLMARSTPGNPVGFSTYNAQDQLQKTYTYIGGKLVEVTQPGSNTGQATPSAIPSNTPTITPSPNNSNPNIPSSSAGPAIGGAITRATDAATQTTPPPPPPTANEKALMDYYGVSIDSIRKQYGGDEFALGKDAAPVIQKQKADAETKAQAEADKEALRKKQQIEAAQADENYGEVLKQFNTQKEGALQKATALSYAANPYAATTSSTGDNHQVINDHFNTLESNLKAQYDLAKAAREAGNETQYQSIVSNMYKSLAANRSDVANTLNQLSSQKLTQESLDFNIQKTAQDDLLNMTKTFGDSPTLQTDLSAYNSTGEASPALQAFFDQGKQAGYQPNEVASIIAYGTSSARKQQDLQEYRDKQLALSQDRLIASQERMSNAQRAIAASSAVAATSAALIGKGVDPTSPAYAQSLALSSGGGIPLDRSQTNKYQGLMQISNSLTDLKKDLEQVDKDNTFKNIVLSHTGASVQSLGDKDLALLNGKINAMAGIIGKTLYGESGNLSDSDIKRILSAMPTGLSSKDVRDSLYNSLVQYTASAASTMLVSDSVTGRNVAGFVPYLKNLNDSIVPVGSTKVPNNIKGIFKKYNLD